MGMDEAIEKINRQASLIRELRDDLQAMSDRAFSLQSELTEMESERDAYLERLHQIAGIVGPV